VTELKCAALFDREKSVAGEYLYAFEFPWDSLDGLENFIVGLTALYEKNEAFIFPAKNVAIAKSATVSKDALILPPCFVDEGAEIRKGAFIRGNTVIGKNCVIGNSCEIKNSVLFDRAKVPHFNYVGDSVLGYSAHLGAGAVTSNVKSDQSEVFINFRGTRITTGRKKLGAMLGDFCEVGCNSVLNPGTVVGRNTTVYPLSSVRGFIEENSIYKQSGVTVKKKSGYNSTEGKVSI